MSATPSGGRAAAGKRELGRPNALAGTVRRSVDCRQASLSSGVASRACAGPAAAGSTSQASSPRARRHLARHRRSPSRRRAARRRRPSRLAEPRLHVGSSAPGLARDPAAVQLPCLGGLDGAERGRAVRMSSIPVQRAGRLQRAGQRPRAAARRGTGPEREARGQAAVARAGAAGTVPGGSRTWPTSASVAASRVIHPTVSNDGARCMHLRVRDRAVRGPQAVQAAEPRPGRGPTPPCPCPGRCPPGRPPPPPPGPLDRSRGHQAGRGRVRRRAVVRVGPRQGERQLIGLRDARDRRPGLPQRADRPRVGRLGPRAGQPGRVARADREPGYREQVLDRDGQAVERASRQRRAAAARRAPARSRRRSWCHRRHDGGDDAPALLGSRPDLGLRPQAGHFPVLDRGAR